MQIEKYHIEGNDLIIETPKNNTSKDSQKSNQVQDSVEAANSLTAAILDCDAETLSPPSSPSAKKQLKTPPYKETIVVCQQVLELAN